VSNIGELVNSYRPELHDRLKTRMKRPETKHIDVSHGSDHVLQKFKWFRLFFEDVACCPHTGPDCDPDYAGAVNTQARVFV
jgi:hypothetical protein